MAIPPPKGPPIKTAKLEREDDGAASASSMEMLLSDEIGRTINNRYRITRVIGEGGMGVVYEAFDIQVDRSVALKLVRNECLADRKFVSRFRRELEVTTQLRHPSTIRVFEHGTAEDGRPYMIMELLRGESLADRLERGRIDEIEALQYARQIAESLSEAHEHGIFHRDLKPDNIFIETVGVTTVVKVLDFGIAGGLDASKLTQAGEVFGTPQYMSPEQCNGLPLDHRTDIYSLGCILFEMLEGKPPFAADSPMATMLKHVKAKVPTPRHCCRETAKVLMTALRKDRTKRIQDCGSFAEMLGQCIGAARVSRDQRGTGPTSAIGGRSPSTGPLAAVPVQSAPTTGPIRTAEIGRKPTLVIAAMAAGFIGIVAALIFGDADDESADTDPANKAPVSATNPAASGDGEKVVKNRADITASVPDAAVLLDGVEQCRTPCQIEVPIDKKQHEIRLQKDQFADVAVLWQPNSVTDDPPALDPMQPSSRPVEVGG